MTYTLVIYDRAAGTLIEARPFAERGRALEERFRLEAKYRSSEGNVEVVVLAAASRDDLMRTHSRYFRSLEELANREAS